MPSCYFYAIGGDLRSLMDFVFSEMPVRVFESASELNRDLLEFRSTDELALQRQLGRCKGVNQSVLLQLWPIEASSEVRFERGEWVNRKGQPEKRTQIKGWGLIQLYLGGESEKGLVHSYTNHNTMTRAMNWSDTYQEQLGHPLAWNWDEVTRTSRKLINYVRRNAVKKHGSRPVLEMAASALSSGKDAL